jgi:arsenate reductase
MKKCYYLKTCSSCQRILKEWELDSSFELQNIKETPITSIQLDEMIALSGSAESLFSRKAMKYKSMGLKNKDLSESDYRKLILDEYTFLKRPVLVVGDEIFIGNSKSVVAAAKLAV